MYFINANKVSLRRFTLLFGLLGYILITACVQAEGITHVVIIKDMKYLPQNITINPGDTIRWENHEKRQYHNVWFEALGEPEPDIFFPDESYERTFEKSGSFPYLCGPHPEMTGTIQVRD